MLRRRIATLEKRLAGLGGPTEKPRLVFCFGDETESLGVKGEGNDKRVFRFDFGNIEGEKK
jgi:hypothetical protein